MKLSDTAKIEMQRKLLESISGFNLKEEIDDWEYNSLIDEINFVAKYTQDEEDHRKKFVELMLLFVG